MTIERLNELQRTVRHVVAIPYPRMMSPGEPPMQGLDTTEWEEILRLAKLAIGRVPPSNPLGALGNRRLRL